MKNKLSILRFECNRQVKTIGLHIKVWLVNKSKFVKLSNDIIVTVPYTHSLLAEKFYISRNFKDGGWAVLSFSSNSDMFTGADVICNYEYFQIMSNLPLK